jgi:LytS/YehU family sensor histidine kinase
MNFVYLSIRNTGTLQQVNTDGFGLVNTTQRLALIFGMKALIIDDERLARNELKRLLEAYPKINVVGEAVNAEDALIK